MKKIFILKNEPVAVLAEKIKADEQDELMLVIPRDSVLKGSAENFRFLKEEALVMNKSISIESVDEEVLMLAKEAGIAATHPFLGGFKGQTISDIVVVKKSKKEPASRLKKAKTLKVDLAQSVPHGGEQGKKMEDVEAVVRETDEGEDDDDEVDESELAGGQTRGDDEDVSMAQGAAHNPGRRSARFLLIAMVVVILAGGAVFVTNTFFAWAEVSLRLKETPWSQSASVIASKTQGAVDREKGLIPAEFFQQNKNYSQLVKATGKRSLSSSSTIRVLIYNNYNALPQTLVAKTRFETPDGKILRLVTQVVVPPAKISNGSTTPSSIEASVIPDVKTADFSKSEGVRLTIPGFKGTPRFSGFYGILKTLPLAQGTSTPYPTDADITQAKEKVSQVLSSSLENDFLNTRPQGFTILPGSSRVTVTKLTVNPEVDENGAFSVFAQANFVAIGIRDADAKELTMAWAAREAKEQNLENREVKDLKLAYEDIKPDFVAGTLQFSLAAEGTLGAIFSQDEFKKSIAGSAVSRARQMLSAVPNLESAHISLWPFWKNSIPASTEKIKINFE